MAKNDKTKKHSALVVDDEIVIFCPARGKNGYVAKEGRKLPHAHCPQCCELLVFDRVA